MIVGIGTDIIEVARIERLLTRQNRFQKRIYTEAEIAYCESKKNKAQNYAARFAAKEAFFKALGKKIKWTDVGVINLSSGKPELVIAKREPLPFDKTHVSLSHLRDYAVACVILEKSG